MILQCNFPGFFEKNIKHSFSVTSACSFTTNTEPGQAPAHSPHANEQAATLLDLLEDSYEEKRVHWKHGGIVGVRGYGGGVIGRYTDSPEKYPAVTEFHTIRVQCTRFSS